MQKPYVCVKAIIAASPALVLLGSAQDTASMHAYGNQSHQSASVCRGWPTEGAIVYDRVSASYRPGLPPVLRELTFSIEVSMISHDGDAPR